MLRRRALAQRRFLLADTWYRFYEIEDQSWLKWLRSRNLVS